MVSPLQLVQKNSRVTGCLLDAQFGAQLLVAGFDQERSIRKDERGDVDARPADRLEKSDRVRVLADVNINVFDVVPFEKLAGAFAVRTPGGAIHDNGAGFRVIEVGKVAHRINYN